MHILIVEDEPQMAGLLKRGLEEEAYLVSVARDGQSALELSSSRKFDAIVLDVMLPKLNGVDVARELRSREHHRSKRKVHTGGDTRGRGDRRDPSRGYPQATGAHEDLGQKDQTAERRRG